MTDRADDAYVVVGQGPDGPLYLDDTAGGVASAAAAKRFRSRVDAEAGLQIAALAPIGGVQAWRIAPWSDVAPD